jgi:hypothetical protein
MQELSLKYGGQRVYYKELSYREQLANSWHVELPQWVSEEQIRDAGLLSVRISAHPDQYFESFVLS